VVEVAALTCFGEGFPDSAHRIKERTKNKKGDVLYDSASKLGLTEFK